MVVWTTEAWQVSQRRACRALGTYRSTVRYVSVRPAQAPPRQRSRELASVRVSCGYRGLHVLLRRDGWGVNRKRGHRLYREEGLCLKRRRPNRRRAAVARQRCLAATAPNERWAVDLIGDALHDGQRLRVLAAVDTWARECVALGARGRFRSENVAAALTRVGLQRGLPAAINVDNGTEITARHLDPWTYAHRVELD